MKLNNKLLALAKGISVWWGIYLILGCCAGFAVKTIQDLFLDVKPFKIMMFAPFMCVGSLLLAIFTYFITNLLKRAPMKRLRRKLVKIFKAEGFSKSYLDMLFANATGDNKNPMLIEAAAAYCVRGETETAAKTLAQADLTSILDVAQSTGDFQTAAYYYCVKMAACIVAKDGSGAAEAYDQGIYYLDAFSDSDMVMAVLALYQTEGGLGNSAIETAKKIKWHSLPRPMRKCGRSFSELIKAKNLLALERYEEAEAAARASMENSCTEFMSSRAEEVLKLADEKKLEADTAKEKEVSEAEKDTEAEEALTTESASVSEEVPETEKPAESSEAKSDEAEDAHDF
ncbi:MAG: hypothetical protein K2J72_11215 [Oscillospiraceae bacterium]|nr:hypothetical protein [Oscillospiraceae bacterium]